MMTAWRTMDDVTETEVVQPQRPRSMVHDMLLSLGLMAIVIAGLLFLGPARTLIMPGSSRAQAVDYSRVVHAFPTQAGRPAVVPSSLPDGWRANAASLHHTPSYEQMHIGWAVPGEKYAGLDEGTGDSAALLRAVVGKSAATVRGTTTIADAPWDVRRSARGETVFTRDVNGVFVIVTGDASDVQLRALAAALH